ncbi:hypothetical protein PIB30_087949 [Stylosanthes scabra]|uniref:Uncharacterized protein n=1 Tax=Stylosanthes scabra TaxID=79078 RepID=A0ABU6UT22_9FABA|nr:hypothetical protein [Stylosanthes scabra]
MDMTQIGAGSEARGNGQELVELDPSAIADPVSNSCDPIPLFPTFILFVFLLKFLGQLGFQQHKVKVQYYYTPSQLVIQFSLFSQGHYDIHRGSGCAFSS